MRLPEIEQRVCDIASEQLGIPRSRVAPSSRLIEDLNGDSLDLIELVMEVEDRLAVTLPHDPPHPVYKAVFTRRSFRLSDLAELVYLQQGTGKPARLGRRDEPARPAAHEAVPFTQLDGRWQPGAGASLFEPLETQDRIGLYRRRSDGMRCVLLPSSEVEIGSDDSGALPDERPVHRAELDGFLIDAEPVSTTAYCRFLNSVDAAEEHLVDWFLLSADDDRVAQMPIDLSSRQWQPLPGTERFPMVLVSWYGANAYSLWANGAEWAEYRVRGGFLPSEAQWEYAARGARSQPFPWGDDSDPGQRMVAGLHERGATYEAQTLPMAAVNDRLGMSPFGLHHMAGNVWQWCRDWYDRAFYRKPEASGRNPLNRHETGVRSERGGSWVGPVSLCRSSHRRGRAPCAKGRCLGFRCISPAVSLPDGGEPAGW